MQFRDIKVGECFIRDVRHRIKDRFGIKTFLTESIVFLKRTPSTGICMRPDPAVGVGRRHELNTLIILQPHDDVMGLGVMEAAAKK
jgi:hypothetical protein